MMMTRYYCFCSFLPLLLYSSLLLTAPSRCQAFLLPLQQQQQQRPRTRQRQRKTDVVASSKNKNGVHQLVCGSSFSTSSFATSSAESSSSTASLPAEQEPPPLPPGRPTRRFVNLFFDDTLRLLNPKKMARYQLSRKKEFGPVFKTNIFFTPTVFVTDDATLQELGAQEALFSKNKDGKNCLQAFFPPHYQKLFGCSSVLVTSGASHDRIRRLMSSSLSPTVVSSVYQPIIEERVNEWFDNELLQKNSDKNVDDEDAFVAMVPRLRSFFIQLMLQVVLGSSNSHDDTLITELSRDIEIWSRGLLAAPLTFVPWSTAGKAMRARKRIVAKLREIIKIRQALGRSNGLLAKLLLAANNDNGNREDGLTEDEIIDNILTLLFAGSDTTASVAISMWKVLSEHASVKLDLLESASDDRVERFVHLVMQSHPPAPFSMRRNAVTDRDVVVGGYRIPPNWLVVYGFAGVLLSRTQPNAWKLEGDEVDSSPSSTTSWVPFGTGPRQCPGRFLANLELKIIARKLATLDWELESGQNLAQRYTPGFFPVDGFRVKFHTSTGSTPSSATASSSTLQ